MQGGVALRRYSVSYGFLYEIVAARYLDGFHRRCLGGVFVISP